MRKLSKRVTDALAKATESAEESLGNLRTVRAFSKELSEIYKYQRSVYDAFKLGRTVHAFISHTLLSMALSSRLCWWLMLCKTRRQSHRDLLWDLYSW